VLRKEDFIVQAVFYNNKSMSSHIHDLASRKSADPRLSGGKGANHLTSLIKTELVKIVADD
jgi:hypothetical protein